MNPSSPVYTGLHPDPHARAHLVFAEGEGAAAVIDLFHQADEAFAGRATLLYTSGATAPPQILSLGATVFPDVPSLLSAAAKSMELAAMGTRIYLAGSMAFIGEAATVAACYGVSRASLMTERRGGTGKRVQCVHCKSITADVVTATVTCPQCKTRLTVRDHYSHRLGAFMGVSCEAEQAR